MKPSKHFHYNMYSRKTCFASAQQYWITQTTKFFHCFTLPASALKHLPKATYLSVKKIHARRMENSNQYLAHALTSKGDLSAEEDYLPPCLLIKQSQLSQQTESRREEPQLTSKRNLGCTSQTKVTVNRMQLIDLCGCRSPRVEPTAFLREQHMLIPE